MSYRLTYKCPNCGRPRAGYYSQGPTRLHMLVCAHMTAAKPTVEETREAWNTLAKSAWARKLSASTPDAGPPNTPSPPASG